MRSCGVDYSSEILNMCLEFIMFVNSEGNYSKLKRLLSVNMKHIAQWLQPVKLVL